MHPPVPAVLIGIIFGPLAFALIDSDRWSPATGEKTRTITISIVRVMIGVQLIIAGFQLPAKYQKTRWKEMMLCLLPVMTLMWLFTSACVILMVPKISLLAALVISSCVTCTDPVLSQAIAKGPFADKYVPRRLREIISSEAGANDGFGYPFLMLAVFLIRHAEVPGAGKHIIYLDKSHAFHTFGHVAGVGRFGGGASVAVANWFLNTWLYVVMLSVVIGAVVGYAGLLALRVTVKR